MQHRTHVVCLCDKQSTVIIYRQMHIVGQCILVFGVSNFAISDKENSFGYVSDN